MRGQPPPRLSGLCEAGPPCESLDALPNLLPRVYPVPYLFPSHVAKSSAYPSDQSSIPA
jgi:hypothetical protein